VWRSVCEYFFSKKKPDFYFKDIGFLDSESSGAMDFLSSTAAIDFCVTNKLGGVQLVLKFDEHR